MCVCNTRTSVLGAPGCARDLQQDGAELKQVLVRRRRAWRHGEARVAAVRRGRRRGETAQGREGGGKAGE
jgi:hypothetical protein